MGTHINLQIMSIKKMLDWIQLPGNNSIPALIASSHGCDQSSLPHNCHIELFEDVDYECAGKSFSWEQACNYADFIRNLPNGTKMIICACNAGESRSAALCAGLCEYYEYDSSWIWDSPLYHPTCLCLICLHGLWAWKLRIFKRMTCS